MSGTTTGLFLLFSRSLVGVCSKSKDDGKITKKFKSKQDYFSQPGRRLANITATRSMDGASVVFHPLSNTIPTVIIIII